MKQARLLSAVAVTGACLAALTTAAAAAAAGPAPSVRSKPVGYTIVSKTFPARAGAESSGQVR
jgi:hypothetical protein